MYFYPQDCEGENRVYMEILNAYIFTFTLVFFKRIKVNTAKHTLDQYSNANANAALIKQVN